MKQDKCNIVKDLMALYVDDMLTEDSKEFVEEHMKTCPECKEEYRQMSAQIQIPMNMDAKPIKKVKRKIWKRMILAVLLTAVVCVLFLVGSLTIVPMDYEKYDLEHVLKVKEEDNCLYLVRMGATAHAMYVYAFPEVVTEVKDSSDGKQHVDYNVYIESIVFDQIHISSFSKEHYATELETEDSIFTSYNRIGEVEEEQVIIDHVYYLDTKSGEKHLLWENTETK